MAVVGAGYQQPSVNNTVTVLARHCMNLKAYGANVQAWFDAACGAANNGTNVTARATALKAKMDDDGSSLTQGDIEDLVKAFDELLYFAATFAPVETLKVCGPSTLV